MVVSKTLKKIREELGFESAKGFYRDYLNQRTRLDFNYTYYMKIEGGKVIPSASVMTSICSGLEEKQSELLLASYCETLFPNKATFFQKLIPVSGRNLIAKKTPFLRMTQMQQRFLTERQVACVSKSRSHYFVFMILTLARQAVPIGSLAPFVGGVAALSVIDDLLEAKLVRKERDQVISIANEMRFPEASSASLKKTYAQLDLWNLEFDRALNFQPVHQKMHLRRVSARYLDLILSHCDLVTNLIKNSDEIDQSHNDEVVMLTLSLSKGILPG